jgi:ribosomal protein S18 acetylase RimI-like enzyme
MIDYRPARREDGPALAAMATQCFCDTFAHLYRRQDLDAFLAAAFGPAGLPAQIGDPRYTIRVAMDGDRLAGFAKLGPCALPDPAPRDAAELKQLYVLKDWQGAGIAPALMDWVIATARAGGAKQLVLSVYVDNLRAQRFYARYGLAEIGKAPFPVGEQIDDDRIWSVML